MKNRKRYQTAKFLGEQWSVVDTKINATVGVHPNRQAAKVAADEFNEADEPLTDKQVVLAERTVKAAADVRS